jgi:hypothetical protein
MAIKPSDRGFDLAYGPNQGYVATIRDFLWFSGHPLRHNLLNILHYFVCAGFCVQSTVQTVGGCIGAGSTF